MGVSLKIHFNDKISFPHKFPETCNVCCGFTWQDAGSLQQAETPWLSGVRVAIVNSLYNASSVSPVALYIIAIKK